MTAIAPVEYLRAAAGNSFVIRGRFLLQVNLPFLLMGEGNFPPADAGPSAMVAIRTVTVRDETADGRAAHEWRLDVVTERLTVRNLIRDRIRREAEEYNTHRPHTWRGLVQPPVEPRSQGVGAAPREFRPVDWGRQFDLACEAFVVGRLLILIGDAQADSLDEEFDIRANTAVTFLRLTPIVGG